MLMDAKLLLHFVNLVQSITCLAVTSPAQIVKLQFCVTAGSCPGVRVEQGRPLAGANSNQELWDLQLARVLQVQPVLLNKQDDTSFSLANTSPRDFSRRVQINTVGGKGSVRIKVTH